MLIKNLFYQSQSKKCCNRTRLTLKNSVHHESAFLHMKFGIAVENIFIIEKNTVSLNLG